MTLPRIFIHTLSALPFVWLCYSILSAADSFGADPGKEIQHFLGFWAISLLIATFLLGGFLHFTKKRKYLILRRAVGIWVWFYALAHIVSYFLLELGLDFRLFGTELVKRNYLILGIIAFVILTLMSISSIKFVKSYLGKYWVTLHKFGYLALVLGMIHYLMSLKNLNTSVVIYGVVSILILALWIFKMVKKRLNLK